MAELPQRVETDEHGNVTDDSLPYFVRDDQALERWRKCLEIAEKITGRHESTQECLFLARTLFDSEYPTHNAAGEFGSSAGPAANAASEGPCPFSDDQGGESR